MERVVKNVSFDGDGHTAIALKSGRRQWQAQQQIPFRDDSKKTDATRRRAE
jgi:hypothetical protein